MRYFQLLMFFWLLLTANHALSNEIKLDSAYIEQVAKDYLLTKYPSTDAEKTVISVARLDPRIIIKSCESPLQAHSQEQTKVRNINVKISCEGDSPWKIYISAKVEISEAVLVAKKTISKGDVLDTSNVELSYVAINKLRGERLTDSNIVFGAKAKKRISQGKTISKRSICLVCKGDVVTITASSSSFSIKTQGVAINSGNINEQIRVRNSRTNKIITGKIKSLNQVVINL